MEGEREEGAHGDGCGHLWGAEVGGVSGRSVGVRDV